MTTPLDTKGNSVVLDELYAIVGMLKLIDAANGKAAILHDTELEKGQTGQFLKLTDLCYASDLAAHVAAVDPHPGYVLESTTSTTPTANFLPIANGSGKLAAGWISEVLALADLSDVTAKTGTGTTVVMSEAPTFTGTANFGATYLGAAGIGHWTTTWDRMLWQYASEPKNRIGLHCNLNNAGMSIGNAPGLMFAGGDDDYRSVIAHTLNDLAFFTGGTTDANAVQRMRITSAGLVGIGIAAPRSPLHLIGTDLRISTNDTDATGKMGVLVVSNYTNTNKPMAVIGGNTGPTYNYLSLGAHGDGQHTSCTTGFFYAAATSTTTSGIVCVGRWNVTGFGVGDAMPASLFHVTHPSAANAFRVDATVGIGMAPDSSVSLTVADSIAIAATSDTGARAVTRVLQRTVGATVGDTTEVGSWAFNNGAGFLEITLTSQTGGYSTAAKYLIPVQYANSELGYPATWLRALPISFTGAYSSNLVEVDTRITDATLDVRLRRVSGAAVATHTLTCTQYGQGMTFTPSTTTATGVSAPTVTSSGTYLTQRAGRVGVGTNAPAYTFDVTGDIRATGSILAHGNTVASAGNLTVTASAGALYLDSTYGNDIIFRPGDATMVAMRVSPLNGGRLKLGPNLVGLYSSGYVLCTDDHFYAGSSSGFGTSVANNDRVRILSVGDTSSHRALTVMHTNGVNILTARGDGMVSVGNVDDALDVLHVVGKVRSASVKNDTTNKTGLFVGGHYTNSEEALGLIGGTSTATTGTVLIGGGISTVNAATSIEFYTAANNVTVTGTKAGQVLGSGTLQWLFNIYVQQAGTGTLALIPVAGDNSIQSSDPTAASAQNLTLCGPSYATLSQIALRASTVYIVGTAKLDGLTASQAVLTDASKNLVSVTLTGSGSLVRATSPTIATPVLVDGAATTQLQLGTGYVSIENEIRFGGLSYSRLSYDVGNGAPYLGYNCKLVGSAIKHDSTGTLAGIRFTGNGDIFLYTNVSAAANTTVTPQVTIDSAGVVGLTALTASKLVATNGSKQLVSYDLVATDIPALTSSNAIQSAKGHRFWMHIAATDLGSALTQLIMPIGGIDSITYPTPLPRACKLVRISITAMHADSTSPPSTWTVDVYKNGSSASTMSFNLNASPFADTTTSGNTSSTINFSADDTIGIKLTGTSLDALVARMSLEFETTA